MLLPIVDLINKYSNLLLSLLTSAYVLLTWFVVREMKYAREAEARPYIIVDSIVAGVRCYLIIKNAGKSVARNVKFEIDRTLIGRGNRVINDLPVFANGIKYFPPGKDFIFDLYPLHELHDKESKCPAEFSIKMTYDFFKNKKTEDIVYIDLREYLFTYPAPDELQKSIERFGSNMSDKLDKLIEECRKIAKLESIANPSGLEISYLTIYKLKQLLKADGGNIKLDLNLATRQEMVEILNLESNSIELIINKRISDGYFKSFEDLVDLDGMTDERMTLLKNKSFICNPYL
jgi:DNA uptake protein ComE-like DNA-binding protein